MSKMTVMRGHAMHGGRLFLLVSIAILLVGAPAFVYFSSVHGIVTSRAQAARTAIAAFPDSIPLPAGVAWSDIVLSANGQHLAFSHREKDGTIRVLLDGKVYASYPATETIYRPSAVIGCFSMPLNSCTIGDRRHFIK